MGRAFQFAHFSLAKPGALWLELIVPFTEDMVASLATGNFSLSSALLFPSQTSNRVS